MTHEKGIKRIALTKHHLAVEFSGSGKVSSSKTGSVLVRVPLKK